MKCSVCDSELEQLSYHHDHERGCPNFILAMRRLIEDHTDIPENVECSCVESCENCCKVCKEVRTTEV